MKDPAVDTVIGVRRRRRQHEHRRACSSRSSRSSERKVSADEVIARLRAEARRTSPARRCFLQAVQDLRIGGRGAQRPVPVHAAGRRPRPSSSCGRRSVLAKLQDPAGAGRRQHATSRTRASRRRSRSTAPPPSRLGITPQAIDDTLYDAFGQRQVSTMYTPLNQYHVVMEVEPQFWQNPDGLRFIYVRSADRRARAALRLHALRARHDAARRQPPGPVSRR